jgi:C1A family cysteine protease
LINLLEILKNIFDTFETPQPYVNLVEDGFKTAVRNQGSNCGSCYAVAAIGAMEGAH